MNLLEFKHELEKICENYSQEWVNDFDREFVVLYHSNHQQCSIRIENK